VKHKSLKVHLLYQFLMTKLSTVLLKFYFTYLFTALSIIIIIIHEFDGDTSLKQNFRAAVNVTY